jgi:hypothetical protein
MSKPQPSGDVHPTRQQLDELDALLRRMLDLPVSPPEEARGPHTEETPTQPPEAPKLRESASPPVSYVVVQTAQKEQPEESSAAGPADTKGEAESWIPFRSSWQPSAQTWGPLAESWHHARGGRPAAPHSEELGPTTPSPVVAVVAAHPSVPAMPPRTVTWRGPWHERTLAPLIWFNRAFDACLAPLGRPGRWLRGPTGRLVLGFVGLACVGAAVVRALTGGILPWTR